MIILLKKNHLSIIALRKALYWLNDECTWNINETNTDWRVEIYCDEQNEQYYSGIVYKLTNDYALREHIDSNTDDLKLAIITKALKDLSC